MFKIEVKRNSGEHGSDLHFPRFGCSKVAEIHEAEIAALKLMVLVIEELLLIKA